MCRDTDHKGRRCPSDTSEARQLRRKNAGARASYGALVTEKVEPKFLEVVPKPEPYTIKSVRSDIEEFQVLGDKLREEGFTSSKEVMIAYDKHLNTIGAGVEYLAEQKYGAPTDEELYTVALEAENKATKAADERKIVAKENVSKLDEEVTALRAKLHEHANPTDYPSMMDRFAKWEAEAPELYNEYKVKEKELGDAQMSVWRSHSSVTQEVNNAKREMLEKRNEAMLSALRDVGVKFADPESLDYSDDSHSDAVKSLKKALVFYPQSWVDASNATHAKHPLRIKRSSGRAHYSADKGQKSFKNKTLAYVTEKPADWVPDPHDRSDSEYIDMKGEDSWVDPKSGIVHEGGLVWRSREVTGPTKKWVSVTYEYKKQDTAPKGKDWEKVELYEEKYVQGEGYIRTGNLVTHYRKPKTRRTNTEIVYKAELTVSKDVEVRVGNDAGMRVALHEFAHRVEHTSPVVTAYEDAFLKRRAGHLQTDENSEVQPEKLTSIYSGAREVGFKDNFATHYMGKVYSGSSYKEILSMGMESLFAGKNGGFAGMDNTASDPDYKRFILGVLASSVKK